jgi:hypothetical protein
MANFDLAIIVSCELNISTTLLSVGHREAVIVKLVKKISRRFRNWKYFLAKEEDEDVKQ